MGAICAVQILEPFPAHNHHFGQEGDFYFPGFYIGSTDKYLYVLDLERRVVKKKLYAASKIFAPPRLLGDRIYFGACNGMIYELDAATVKITGTHQLPDAVTNPVTYNAETGDYYALTYVNQLFAFVRVRAL